MDDYLADFMSNWHIITFLIGTHTWRIDWLGVLQAMSQVVSLLDCWRICFCQNIPVYKKGAKQASYNGRIRNNQQYIKWVK